MKKKEMDIDLVYLWVDGSDPEWLAKKNSYLPDDRQLPPDVAGTCRYVENDELRYSLRSAERFAPWIRRIFIVTDDQTPRWLDTENPRVQVVFHRDFIPAEVLPLFNSAALEWFLPDIPGLSEHFLYANDDMFFGAPVDPGFFFEESSGLPIARLKSQRLKKHDDDIYCHKILCMQQLVRARFGRCTSLAPHHNVDAYLRTDFLKCRETFRNEMPLVANRFRADEDWQRSLALYYSLAMHRAILRKVNRYNKVHGLSGYLHSFLGKRCGSDSRCIPAYTQDLQGVMDKYAPSLFCLNDDPRVSDADRRRIGQFLETLFPGKSSFEK